MTAAGRAAEDLSAGGPAAKVRRLQLTLALRPGRWCFHPQIDALLRLAELRLAAGVEAGPLPVDAGERLERLRGEASLVEYVRGRDRCREAALALGVGWPPVEGFGRREVFVFCFEEQGRVPVPVVYPSDFDAAVEEDLYGFGERREAGVLLLVPVEDLPLQAEVVVDRRPAASVRAGAVEGAVPPRVLPRVRRELGRGDDDRVEGRGAEVVPGLEGLAGFEAWRPR